MPDKTTVVFVPVTTDPTTPDWDPDGARLAGVGVGPPGQNGQSCPFWRVPLEDAHRFVALVTRPGATDVRDPSTVGGFGKATWVGDATYRKLVSDANNPVGATMLVVYKPGGGAALVGHDAAVHPLGDVAKDAVFWPSAATDFTLPYAI